MLRITRLEPDGASITIRVEGHVLNGSAPVLEEECAQLLARFDTVRVDLSDVRDLDPHGAAALNSLRGRRVTLTNVPPLIRDILDEEARGS